MHIAQDSPCPQRAYNISRQDRNNGRKKQTHWSDEIWPWSCSKAAAEPGIESLESQGGTLFTGPWHFFFSLPGTSWQYSLKVSLALHPKYWVPQTNLDDQVYKSKWTLRIEKAEKSSFLCWISLQSVLPWCGFCCCQSLHNALLMGQMVFKQPAHYQPIRMIDGLMEGGQDVTADLSDISILKKKTWTAPLYLELDIFNRCNGNRKENKTLPKKPIIRSQAVCYIQVCLYFFPILVQKSSPGHVHVLL